MGRLPACAVLRHDNARAKFFQRLNRRCNDRLETGPGQMKTADHRLNSIDARHLSSALERVNDAGMTAAGEDDEPFVPDAQNDRLVVVDPRIGLPAAIDPGYLRTPAFCETHCAGDLSRPQRAPADDHRRPALLDDFHILSLEIALAGRNMLRLMTVRLNVLALEIGIGMQNDRDFR